MPLYIVTIGENEQFRFAICTNAPESVIEDTVRWNDIETAVLSNLRKQGYVANKVDYTYLNIVS